MWHNLSWPHNIKGAHNVKNLSYTESKTNRLESKKHSIFSLCLQKLTVSISFFLNSVTIFVYHNASFSNDFYGYTASLENYIEPEIALLVNIIMHLIFTCYKP